MDIFEKRKQDALGRIDKSRKGSIDPKIKKICNKINSHKDYFTTSSCSGRIVLIKLDGKSRKMDSEWLFTTHDKVKKDEIRNILNILESEIGDIWFKQEPMILHVCCRNVEAGDRLWMLAREAGYKRGGLTKGKNWYTLEIIGSEFIEAPFLLKNWKMNIESAKIFISEANKRMKRSDERMKKLEKSLSRL